MYFSRRAHRPSNSLNSFIIHVLYFITWQWLLTWFSDTNALFFCCDETRHKFVYYSFATEHFRVTVYSCMNSWGASVYFQCTILAQRLGLPAGFFIIACAQDRERRLIKLCIQYTRGDKLAFTSLCNRLRRHFVGQLCISSVTSKT